MIFELNYLCVESLEDSSNGTRSINGLTRVSHLYIYLFLLPTYVFTVLDKMWNLTTLSTWLVQ